MPDENEVYLAVPYLNEDGLELYTRLILRKLASLVITSTTNLHDYEQEYSANPAVEVRVLHEGVDPGTVYTLPLSYGVGTGQLRVTVSGYVMYLGIDYEEVGDPGTVSNQIRFLTSIEPKSILGVVVYPKQFSFGRNINVSSLVAPELALSDDPDSILHLDSEGKLILERSEIESIVNGSAENVLHVDGEETVLGLKTFKTPLKVDVSETNLEENQTLPLVNAVFKANGMTYSMQPLTVVAGSAVDEPYSGTLMVGSTTGCTWIGSGDSFLNLPEAFNTAGIDFANDESVIVSSDSKISFYVGCANNGSSFIKAAEILADGTTHLHGAAYAVTPSDGDTSTRIATTEFVKNVAMTSDGDQNITGHKTYLTNVTVSNESPWLELVSEDALKGEPPLVDIQSGISMKDGAGNDMGKLKHVYGTDGSSSMVLEVMDLQGDGDPASMGIAIDSNGNPYAFAPTPASGDSSTAIATTEFVSGALNVFRNELITTIQSMQQEVDISSITEEQINTLF